MTSVSSSMDDSSQPSSPSTLYRPRALLLVSHNARAHWITLPSEWQVDKEFVLTALKRSPTLPEKSDFERKLPQKLRFDKDIVLAFCHRPDFEELYETRHLFVPGCLTGDKEVMLAYCQKIPRSLQECSEELCDSPNVVHAAICLGGLELQYASIRLQEDKATVMQACRSHGRALEFCPPGKTRNELAQDREFMLNIVLANKGGGSMWRLLASHLKDDQELLLMALKNGLLLRDIPTEFANLEFLTSAVQANSSLYIELPRPWRVKEELARQAILSESSTPEIHVRALEECPHLRRDRNVVLQIARQGSLEFLQEFISSDDFQYHDDLQVMRLAIERDTKFFAHSSRRLQHLPEIILVSITSTSAWNTLKVVPWAIQRNHPEIPTRAIEISIFRNLRYLPSHIPEDLWSSNRNLGTAWIRRGGRVLDSLEIQLRHDRQLGLEVARHNWSEFYKVGEILLRDREFMLEALEQDGRVIRFASADLTQDVDVLITAVAHHPALPTHGNNDRSALLYSSTLSSTFSGICNLAELKEQIQSKLNLHSSFLLDFLRGIAISPHPNVAPNLRSQLPMLDRGVETSQAFKELIGDYLGVPTGRDLRLLRKALGNLQQSVINASTSSNASNRPVHIPAQILRPREERGLEPNRIVMGLEEQEEVEMDMIQQHRRARRLVHLRHRMHLRHAFNRFRPPGAVRLAAAARAAEESDDDSVLHPNANEDDVEAEEERMFAAAMARHRQQQEDEMNQEDDDGDQRLILLQDELDQDLEMEFMDF
jgi:hypothetical protein